MSVSQSFYSTLSFIDYVSSSAPISANIDETLNIYTSISQILLGVSVSESLSIRSSLSVSSHFVFSSQLGLTDRITIASSGEIFLLDELKIYSSMVYKTIASYAVSEELQISSNLSSSVSTPTRTSYISKALKSPWIWVAAVIVLILIAASAKPKIRK